MTDNTPQSAPQNQVQDQADDAHDHTDLELADQPQSIMDHLIELRRRLLYSFMALAVFTIGCYIFVLHSGLHVGWISFQSYGRGL